MVKIFIAGCVHGNMTTMYKNILETETKYGYKIDLVLCCGDFQSLRNNSDLRVMASPDKYKVIGDFWKYYAGVCKAPYLTVFVGGNHEASNYLQELPYGGWVAPDIYYLGYAGVVNVFGLRIAGMSGIYSKHDYYTGHYEHVPYNESSKRTAYHSRSIETLRLTQIKGPIDIVLSHDWPRGITDYSNQLPLLLKNHPNFTNQIEEKVFGNPSGEKVLIHLKPRYWFSAHNHCKFAASVQFPGADNRVTKFLALDKCLPDRHYLQFIDIEPMGDAPSLDRHLKLDPDWLCILKATNHLMSLTKYTIVNRDFFSSDYSSSDQALQHVTELFDNQFDVPDNFTITGLVHDGMDVSYTTPWITEEIYTNPQTDYLCDKLGIVNPNRMFLSRMAEVDSLGDSWKKCSLSKSRNEMVDTN